MAFDRQASAALLVSGGAFKMEKSHQQREARLSGRTFSEDLSTGMEMVTGGTLEMVKGAYLARVQPVSQQKISRIKSHDRHRCMDWHGVC